VYPQELRTRAILSIALVLALGLLSKFFYHGPAHVWVNDSLGGVFYVILWSLGVFFLMPRRSPGRIAAAVLAATCALEFLQLWHPPFLQMLRHHLLGRSILGTDFDWTDFPYYFAGAAITWMWLHWLRGYSQTRLGTPRSRSFTRS
jgi:Protein of unknown function (DUF2809)